MGLFVPQVQNMQPLQGLLGSWDHLFARHAQRFKPKTDLIDHVGTQNLPFGVLQQGPHMPRDIRKSHPFY